MSIELMSRVWRIELSHSQQAVLLAMADFANDDGRNCYPSHKRLAWKTGYSERQISRLINELIELGIVKVIKLGTNNQPPRYWIRINKGTPKKPFDSESLDDEEDGGDILSPQENRDDKMSPLNSNVSDTGGDKMSPPDVALVTPRDDTVSSDPSVNHQSKQPSKEKEIAGATPATPDTWPDFLVALCWICHGHKDLGALTEKQKGILTSEAKRIYDKGYTIDDLRAWFRDTWQKDWRWTKDKQHERPEPSDVRSMIPAIREQEPDIHTNGYHVEVDFQPTIHPVQHLPFPPPLPRPSDDPWAIAVAELSRTLAGGFVPMLQESRLELAGEIDGEDGKPARLYRLIVPAARAAQVPHFIRQAGTEIQKKLSSILSKRVYVEIVVPEQEPS